MNKVIQYTGLMSSFLFLCGILKFYLYYKAFNISILRFFDLQEVITLFMDNLIAYFAIIIPTTVCIFLFYKRIKNYLGDYALSNFNIFCGQISLISFFVIISIIGALIYFFMTKGVTGRDFLFISLLIIVCYVLVPFSFVFLKRFLFSNAGTDIQFVDLYLLLLGVLLLGYTILISKNEVFKVKNGGYYNGVVVTLKDNNIIESNKTKYFIGMTKNYFFIYDESSMSCTAYKSDEIRSIKFP